MSKSLNPSNQLARSVLVASAFIFTSCATTEPAKTRVYISDGSKQCMSVSTPIEQNQNLLLNNRIETYAAQCGRLMGMSFMAVCGGQTGKVHVFEIDADDLASAEQLGFKAESKLRQSVRIETTECAPTTKKKRQPQ